MTEDDNFCFIIYGLRWSIMSLVSEVKAMSEMKK